MWTSTSQGKRTTYAQIAGGVYATLADIRALADLADPARYPTARLVESRQWAQALIEDYCRVAFVPRYAREQLTGSGAPMLILPRPRPRLLLAATVDGAAVTSGDLAAWTLKPSGVVERTSAFPAGRPVVVAYEHGEDAPPADLKEACLTLCRYWLLNRREAMFDRARAVRDELGVTYLSQPGDRRPSGLPAVDAVLNRYADITPSVG